MMMNHHGSHVSEDVYKRQKICRMQNTKSVWYKELQMALIIILQLEISR